MKKTVVTLVAVVAGLLIASRPVAAHHGALSKRTRQTVERRLQRGELKAVVATASLELGRASCRERV